MKARQSNQMKPQAPADTHLARIVGIVKLGHQPGFTWNGKEIESQYKVEITYELVDTEMEEGKPFWVSEEVKDSDNEKSTLYARCKAASCSVYELDKLINASVMVRVTHNDKGYAKVDGQSAVSGVPGSIVVASLRNDSFIFDPYHPDMDEWTKLPEFKKNKIQNSLDYQEMAISKLLKADDEKLDDLPY